MSNLWIVAGNILQRMLKKPGNFIIHLILPVATSIFIFLIFSSSSSSLIQMAVVDHDQSATSVALLASIENMGKFNLVYVDEENAAAHMIADNSVSFAYIIPENFEATILNQEEPSIEVQSVGQNEGTAWIGSISDFQIKNVIDMAMASNYDQATYQSLLQKLDQGDLNLVSESVSDESYAKEVVSQSMGMYLMLLMISVTSVSFKVIEERQNGTFARIGMAPVYSKIYTLANILVSMLIVMVQIMMVLFGLKIANMNFYMPQIKLFVILFVFALATISLGLMLAAFTKVKEGAGALISLVLTPTCMIAGCFWPFEYMPSYLQKIGYLTPQRWTLDAISKMQITQDFQSILPNLAVVLGFALLFFLIAAYQFENQDKKMG
jgi:ABC-2 type transport system permease protein